MSTEDDPILKRLRDLPRERPDDLRAERVRRRAQAALAEERGWRDWPRLRPVARAFTSAGLPLLLLGTVGLYLSWAVAFTSGLYETGSAVAGQAQLRRSADHSLASAPAPPPGARCPG